jgi:hypothetical protein
MLKRGTQRNLAAIKAGTVTLRLGRLERLPQLGRPIELFGGPVDKLFSVNVFQFLSDRTAAVGGGLSKGVGDLYWLTRIDRLTV